MYADVHEDPSISDGCREDWHGLFCRLQFSRTLWAVTFILCFSGMVGYGMAKAAVHQLCQSLAAKNSGMPPGAAAVAILPWVLRGCRFRKQLMLSSKLSHVLLLLLQRVWIKIGAAKVGITCGEGRTLVIVSSVDEKFQSKSEHAIFTFQVKSWPFHQMWWREK